MRSTVLTHGVNANSFSILKRVLSDKKQKNLTIANGNEGQYLTAD